MDKQIPVSHFKRFLEAATEPKQLILLPHAGHRNVGGEDANMYTEGLTNFSASISVKKQSRKVYVLAQKGIRRKD